MSFFISLAEVSIQMDDALMECYKENVLNTVNESETLMMVQENDENELEEIRSDAVTASMQPGPGAAAEAARYNNMYQTQTASNDAQQGIHQSILMGEETQVTTVLDYRKQLAELQQNSAGTLSALNNYIKELAG